MCVDGGGVVLFFLPEGRGWVGFGVGVGLRGYKSQPSNGPLFEEQTTSTWLRSGKPRLKGMLWFLFKLILNKSRTFKEKWMLIPHLDGRL